MRATNLRDGNNNQTAVTRNLRGLTTKMQYPGAETVEYGNYDPAGRVGTKIDTINGQPRIASYNYMGPGRTLSNVTYDGNPELNVGITRDTEGWVTDYSDGSGQVHINPTNGYDLSGNVLNGYASRTNGPAYLPFGNTYNPDGSPATQMTAMGNSTFSYDGLGRPDGFTDASNGVTNWEYAPGTGHLQQQTLPNGAYTTYEYNARGQVESMSHYKADATLLAEYTDITYDGVGNITGFIVNLPTIPQYSGTKTFHYDSKGRLDEETFTPDGQYTTDYDYTYGYDAAGNATVFNGTERHYNSNNQWTEELVNGTWETMATYDGAGNPTGYKGHTLEFDAENRLTDYDNGDLLAGYDGDGLRAWKEVNGTRTHFVLDGTDVVGELNNNGAALFTNNFGPNGLISRYNNTSQTAVYYLFDPLGNVQHRLDGDGDILSSDIYDAWGNLIDGGDATDPFGYKGEYGYYTDQETGLILCGHRYYDPTTGRWINRDPIGYNGGINQYVYCEDDPVNSVDPNGTGRVLIVIGNDQKSHNNAFKDNAALYQALHPENTYILVYASDFTNAEKLMDEVIKQSNGGIDTLLIESHGCNAGNTNINVIRDHPLTPQSDWASIHFNKGATIVLTGCNSGGSHGKASSSSVAQSIANATNTTVFAYVNYTSQQEVMINGKKGTKQVPCIHDYEDRGHVVTGYKTFKPVRKQISINIPWEVLKYLINPFRSNTFL